MKRFLAKCRGRDRTEKTQRGRNRQAQYSGTQCWRGFVAERLFGDKSGLQGDGIILPLGKRDFHGGVARAPEAGSAPVASHAIRNRILAAFRPQVSAVK